MLTRALTKLSVLKLKAFFNIRYKAFVIATITFLISFFVFVRFSPDVGMKSLQLKIPNYLNSFKKENYEAKENNNKDNKNKNNNIDINNKNNNNRDNVNNNIEDGQYKLSRLSQHLRGRYSL